MKKESKLLLILWVIILSVVGCKQATTEAYKEYPDFFNQKKYNGEYAQTLPFHSVDSMIIRIRAEVPPKWYGRALENAYYHFPPTTPDSIAYIYLDKCEAAFPDDSVRAMTQATRGNLFYASSKYDTAEVCLQDCYNLSIKGKNLLRASDAIFRRGTISINRGQYPKGIQMVTEAYEVAYNIDPTDGRMFERILSLAVAYRKIEDNEMAFFWSKKAWAYACAIDTVTRNKDATKYRILAGTWMARAYQVMNKLDSAKLMMNTVFRLSEKDNQFHNTIMVRFTRAGILVELGNCKEAMIDYWVARNLFTFDSPEYMSRLNKGMGDGYLCLGKLDSAQFFYTQALTTPDTFIKSQIHLKLATIYEKQGKKILALEQKVLSSQLHGYVITSEKDKELARMQVKAEVESRIKEAESKKQTAQMWAIGGFLLLIVMSIVARGWFVQSKRKQKNLIQRQAFAEVQTELTTQALNKSEQVVSAQGKALELAEQRLALKEELIQKMELGLAKNERAKTADAQHDENTMPEPSFQGLRLLTTEDWMQFRAIFDPRFPNFGKQLKKELPQLTPAETRLVLLLKAEFNASEIAHVLGVSLSSVYTSRYRLRRKLSLEEDTDLEAFIKSFGQAPSVPKY